MKKTAAAILVALGVGFILYSIYTGKDKIDLFNDLTPRTDYHVVYELSDDVDARYKEIWALQNEAVIEFEEGTRYGFSYNKGSTCVIVIDKNIKQKQLERTVGHENLHCMFGAFHK